MGVTQSVTSFAVRAAATALASFYFMGWAYVRFYYRFFGLSMDAMDIPLYSIFTFSTNVFVHPTALGAKVVCLVVAGVACVVAWRRPALRRPVAVFAMVLALPALRWVAYVSAQQIAARQVRGDTYRPVEVVLDAVPGAARAEFRAANTAGRLRLITQTRSAYYLLVWEERLADDPRDLIVYEIPTRHVAQVRRLAPGVSPGLERGR